MFKFIFELATEPLGLPINGITNGLFYWLLVK